MNFVLFWWVPPSHWKTLSPKKIPNEFCTLLMSTTVLLEDSISKRRYQMNFVLSRWVPPSYWKTLSSKKISSCNLYCSTTFSASRFCFHEQIPSIVSYFFLVWMFSARSFYLYKQVPDVAPTSVGIAVFIRIFCFHKQFSWSWFVLPAFSLPVLSSGLQKSS